MFLLQKTVKMKLKQFFFLWFALFLTFSLSAQEEENNYDGGIGSGGTVWGFKGGPSLATQMWNGFQRAPLFSYHGDVFIEVLGPWKDKKGTGSFKRSSFGAQLGYHRKGSSLRSVFYYTDGKQVKLPSNVFHNISLTAFGKGAFKTSQNSNFFYGMGLRLDYTLTYSLIGYGLEGVNRPNYGIWLGAGHEWRLKDALGLFVELSISPDISKQIFVPPGYPTGLYYSNGNPIMSQGQKVNNLLMEISIGIKFGKEY